MKQSVQAAVVQYRPAGGAQRSQNLDFFLTTMEEEAGGGGELVVFPEVSITNFFKHGPGGLHDLWVNGAIDVDGPEISAICDLARRRRLHTVVGFNERAEISGLIYNSAALIGPDGVIGVARKQNFPGVEKLYYTPGRDVATFDCALGKIGIVICYDVLFPEIVRQHFLNGAELMVFSSSFWQGGSKGGVGDPETKRKLWQELPFVTAVQNQAFVVSANACGAHDLGGGLGEWVRMGMSQIVSPAAGVLARADQGSETILRATLAERDLLQARANYRFITEARTRPSGVLAM